MLAPVRKSLCGVVLGLAQEGYREVLWEHRAGRLLTLPSHAYSGQPRKRADVPSVVSVARSLGQL